MKRFPFLIMMSLLVLAQGCASIRSDRDAARAYYSRQLAKPVVAVTDFENLANASGKWNLGEGMADLLVTDLVDTERVTVLERKDLKDVLEEIVLQGGDLFRREGRVRRGRLKNARYVIRGSVTDFTETTKGSAEAGNRFLRIFGGGDRARVAVNIRVADVETGEIVSSVKAAESVGAGGAGVKARYKDMVFGGDAFFRTPLGKATEGAIRKAVREILRDLPVERWEPRVAEAGVDYVIINGGENVKVRKGDVFLVRKPPREITDPATGNVIEIAAGDVVGWVTVTKVNEQSSHAVLKEGVASRGDYLEERE